MNEKKKKQYGFQNKWNKNGYPDDYQRLQSITTMHSAVTEEEEKAVKKAIEELVDCCSHNFDPEKI